MPLPLPPQRVRLIIADLDIPVDYIDVHLKDKPVWYIPKINPHGKVPVVEHEGRLIRESIVGFGEFRHVEVEHCVKDRLMPFDFYAMD